MQTPLLATKLFKPLPRPDLVPRELEVLKLVAEGLTNREISERLFVALDRSGDTTEIFMANWGSKTVRRR